MNFREGVRRLYLVLCVLIAFAIVAFVIGTIPEEKSVRYSAADRVLDSAKAVGLTHGDGRRYGAYSEWSSEEIYAGFCPADKTIGPMLRSCEANQVTARQVLQEQAIHLGKGLGFLLMFALGAGVVLNAASWIASGFAGKSATPR